MTRPIVIVGASLAGLRAAQAIRNAGHDGPVVVVGDEQHLPYTRPPLSKELLAGAHEAEQCALPNREIDVEWRLGTTATGLDPARRELELDGGERLAYDRLLIATGARARTWPAPLPAGVVVLRGARRRARAARRVRRQPRARRRGRRLHRLRGRRHGAPRGLDVTLIDIAPLPMTALGPAVGERCAALHRERGVDLRLGTGVAGFEGGERLSAVSSPTARASRPTSPSSRSARSRTPSGSQGSGLDLQPGVVCDATLVARGTEACSPPATLAAWPHPLADGETIRIEHWTNAAEQGAAAARNLLAPPAERTPYEAVPYFWTDQYDVKIQSVGLPARAERVTVLEATPEGDRLVLGGERDGRLVAAIGFNAARRLPFYRGRLAARPPFEEVVAAVRADEKAFGDPKVSGMRRGARHPARRDRPAGLFGEWMDARGIAYDVHRTDHGGPLPEPAGYAFVASLGSKRTRATPTTRPSSPSSSCWRAPSPPTSRCSASASAARRSPPCSARASRPRRAPSSAGRRSRPTTPASCPRARGSNGTTSASARRPARPSSPARRSARRPSATAATSASSSTRRARPRSSNWAASDRERIAGSASTTARR